MKSTHTVHDMTENVAEIWNTIIKINTHAHILPCFKFYRPDKLNKFNENITIISNEFYQQ